MVKYRIKKSNITIFSHIAYSCLEKTRYLYTNFTLKMRGLQFFHEETFNYTHVFIFKNFYFNFQLFLIYFIIFRQCPKYLRLAKMHNVATTALDFMISLTLAPKD